MTASEWGVWFGGFTVFAGADVLQHWETVPCARDGAVIANTGYNIYKYVDSYLATNDSTYMLTAAG
jgi:hypothetical protein